MKVNILLTGATGFLGRHLLESLTENDFTVSILVRKSSDINSLVSQKKPIKIYLIEDEDLESLFCLNNFEAIIHTATSYGRKDETKDEIFYINYRFPKLLLELSGKYKVKYFLNTDTFFNKEIDLPSGLDYYVTSKKEFLDYSENFSVKDKYATIFVNMTIYQMYGPGDSKEKFTTYLIGQLINNSKELNLTSGKQTRDFIYVLDVVRAILHIIAFRKQIINRFVNFNIGTGIETSLKEMVLATKQLCSSETKLNFGNLKQRNGEIMRSVANNESLLNLGWKPLYTLDEGLKQTIHSINNI